MNATWDNLPKHFNQGSTALAQHVIFIPEYIEDGGEALKNLKCFSEKRIYPSKDFLGKLICSPDEIFVKKSPQTVRG